MLIKEYRICLPLTVEEYRIAQLYMIQKKSRQESSGAGSGVEILVNEPYSDGPGPTGKGQYTNKIYHIGSHLPGWFRAILPKSALIVQEEAWNAYPYTKTIYRCPFIEKFFIEIETVYHNDSGTQENVFNMTSSDLSSRVVDYIDIVTDAISSSEYSREEDPRLFKSEKTGRGPLTDSWREDYASMVTQNGGGVNGGVAIMCAYKLCRVEFRYWGMQGKIERFIHDTALRKTMVRAHRQAWCWQDEYFGLSMEDIRQLELETQRALKEKMAHADEEYLDADGNRNEKGSAQTETNHVTSESAASTSGKQAHFQQPDSSTATAAAPDSVPPRVASVISVSSSQSRRLSYQSTRSRVYPDSTLEKLQTSSSEEDEFFDADDEGLEFTARPPRGAESLVKSSSMEFINQPEDDESERHGDRFGYSLDHRLGQIQRLQGCHNQSVSLVSSGKSAGVLFLVLHGGSLLDTGQQDHLPSKQADLSTFVTTLNHVARHHYSTLYGRIAVRLVCCPNICNEALSQLACLTPYHSDVSATLNVEAALVSENFPLSAVALFATMNPDYCSLLSQVVQRANNAYASFLQSPEGIGFNGQVFLLADSVGSIVSYDILSQSGSSCNPYESQTTLVNHSQTDTHAVDASSPQQGVNSQTTASTVSNIGSFDFEVSDFFMFGSPVGIVLAFRQLVQRHRPGHTARPACNQLYNIFYSSHPSAARMETLISSSFRHIAPVSIPRFHKFPYGDATPIYMAEIQWLEKELPSTSQDRRPSACSSHSSINTVYEPKLWWGTKRIDYAVYCPDALKHFPMAVLPHLLHASLWESTDVIAFILRQVMRIDRPGEKSDAVGGSLLSTFKQEQPREKWLRRRTSMKLRNLTANHRANDVIVTEGKAQILVARFMYGPLDLSLSNEKVDVHIMTNPPVSKWTYFDTAITDANGRVVYNVPDDRRLSEGIYPVKMVVRGDHTWADFYLAVIQPKTDAVVFSIDGSFTASVSIMGKDPKVRPGAVDVVRHWHERGFLVLYITARPDMQQRTVVSWLAQHNFPHGMVAFMDRLSVFDPMHQKTNYLKQLVNETQLNVFAAYGSSKDIAVYQAIGLQPNQMYIVGKVVKKHRKDAIIIADGYTAHLKVLESSESVRPPVGNIRLSMRKGCFGFPSHSKTGSSGTGKHPIRKTTSLPQRTASTSSAHAAVVRPLIAVSEAGNTIVTSGLTADTSLSCGSTDE